MVNLPGSLSELDKSTKRWAITGVVLHSVLTPAMRQSVEETLEPLYENLKKTNNIDTQLYPCHLTDHNSIFLNYGAINGNKTLGRANQSKFDYKVKDAVDLSKLFVTSYVATYGAYDEICDPFTLLEILFGTCPPSNICKSYAIQVKKEVRNNWAHFNKTDWDDGQYKTRMQLMIKFIESLQLKNQEKIICKLNEWIQNGNKFIDGTLNECKSLVEIQEKIKNVLNCFNEERSFETQEQQISNEVIVAISEIGQDLDKVLVVRSTDGKIDVSGLNGCPTKVILHILWACIVILSSYLIRYCITGLCSNFQYLYWVVLVIMAIMAIKCIPTTFGSEKQIRSTKSKRNIACSGNKLVLKSSPYMIESKHEGSTGNHENIIIKHKCAKKPFKTVNTDNARLQRNSEYLPVSLNKRNTLKRYYHLLSEPVEEMCSFNSVCKFYLETTVQEGTCVVLSDLYQEGFNDKSNRNSLLFIGKNQFLFECIYVNPGSLGYHNMLLADVKLCKGETTADNPPDKSTDYSADDDASLSGTHQAVIIATFMPVVFVKGSSSLSDSCDNEHRANEICPLGTLKFDRPTHPEKYESCFFSLTSNIPRSPHCGIIDPRPNSCFNSQLVFFNNFCCFETVLCSSYKKTPYKHMIDPTSILHADRPTNPETVKEKDCLLRVQSFQEQFLTDDISIYQRLKSNNKTPYELMIDPRSIFQEQFLTDDISPSPHSVEKIYQRPKYLETESYYCSNSWSNSWSLHDTPVRSNYAITCNYNSHDHTTNLELNSCVYTLGIGGFGSTVCHLSGSMGCPAFGNHC